MNSLHEQLARAYREQQKIYEEIKRLVNEQIRAMEEGRDPRAVLGLCRRVEERMADIAVIEDAIEPVKRKWERAGEGSTDDLDAVLGFVEAAIEEIVRGQQRVQQLDFSTKAYITDLQRADLQRHRHRPMSP